MISRNPKRASSPTFTHNLILGRRMGGPLQFEAVEDYAWFSDDFDGRPLTKNGTGRQRYRPLGFDDFWFFFFYAGNDQIRIIVLNSHIDKRPTHVVDQQIKIIAIDVEVLMGLQEVSAFV